LVSLKKLRKKINQNVQKFQTLYAIVNDEIDAQTTNAKNSATDALLWLKRYLLMQKKY
jgi:pleckstrin family protein A (phosphoinositide binding specific) protein 8